MYFAFNLTKYSIGPKNYAKIRRKFMRRVVTVLIILCYVFIIYMDPSMGAPPENSAGLQS